MAMRDEDKQIARSLCIPLERYEPRWPRMRRLSQDRIVIPHAGGVWIWSEDWGTESRKARRTLSGPLRGMTPEVWPVGGNWWRRDFVDGRHPDPHSKSDMREILASLRALHESKPDERMLVRGAETARRYRTRVCERAQRASVSKGLLREIRDWRGWDELESTWLRVVPWHGDPSLSNVLLTPDGRVVLIDHAAEGTGILEYDLAKLRREQYLSNEMEVLRLPEPGDLHLAVVLAGMLGSHGEIPELVACWRAASSR